MAKLRSHGDKKAASIDMCYNGQWQGPLGVWQYNVEVPFERIALKIL